MSSVGEPGTCLCGSVWPFGSDLSPEPQRNREVMVTLQGEELLLVLTQLGVCYPYIMLYLLIFLNQ